MKKKSERMNVLTEGDSKNFIHAILNAVTKGYSDNTIIEDVIEMIRTNDISKGILITAPDALCSYGKSLSNSLNSIAQEIRNIEIQDAQELIVKRKKLEEKRKENNEDEEAENGLDDNGRNVIEEEMDRLDGEVTKIEEKKREELEQDEDDDVEDLNYQSKIASKDITITEDWEKSGYNESEDKIAGNLNINFNQNMSIYKKGNQLNLDKLAIDYITNKVFSYFKNEYPRLKVKLSTNIFKENIVFDDVGDGKAHISYEINKPFKV